MKILFMGTPDFAQESLNALHTANYDIVGVVTNPDKPQGRGMKLVESPVKMFAKKNNLKIYQPLKIRNNPEFIEEIKKLKLDLICVVAYGKILPKELLEIPKYGCINVHGSLLPKYRGAAPIQWAVLNGDKETGITTMYMDEGMDTGDIILQEKVTIDSDETTGELWQKLSRIGAKLLVETVEQIEEGTIKRQKQPENFTLAPMLSKDMANIDWENKKSIEIKNLVRGLNPIMGAYSYLNNKKIKFWRVNILSNKQLIEKYPELEEYKNKLDEVEAGTVLFSNPKQGLYIKANNGIICAEEVQGENAKRMNIHDFLIGNNINAGEIFKSNA